MENTLNNSNFSSLLGLDACSLDNTNFQFFVNKPLGNGKQYIGNGANTTSEINNSLLNTLNVIDTSFKNEANTYTLDDLLDFGNEELNSTSFFDASLDDEALLYPNVNGFVSNEFLMETAMASPLSSSSEESCDLDEILFLDETPSAPVTDGNAVTETEILNQESLNVSMNDHQYAIENTNAVNIQSSLGEMNVNGADLSALCSLLFQNQGIAIPEPTQEVTNITEPISPASSESESEEIRYKPYKKPKTAEQKLRKKAQNRTAATRYRVKKKDELKLMCEEADQLEEKNKDLRGKVDGLRTEIDYLKNLMLDVIKARLAKGALPENLLSVVLAK